MNKKILSIDGGGIKGVFPAAFLAATEDMISGNLADYFDLIIGTSTGGIIALGLGLGLSAKDILNFYEKHGPDIFKGNRFLKYLRHWGFAKYGHEPLEKALATVFGDRKLGESRNRLVIPSCNLDTGEVYVYKTAHHVRFKNDYRELAVHVALATSSAPTYFPVHRTLSGTSLVDGGLWANNPMGLSAVEGVGVLLWPKDQIKLLSVGCTAEALAVKNQSGGIFQWAPQLTDIFMASQSSASLGTAQLLIGHDNVVRINPQVPNGRYGLDVIKGMESLKGLGASEARKAYPNIQGFFTEKAEPFNPYYQLTK